MLLEVSRPATDPLLATHLMEQSTAQPADAGTQGAALLAKPSSSLQSSQGADTYWQLLGQGRENQLLDPNGWTAYELALDSNMLGRSDWWSAPS